MLRALPLLGIAFLASLTSLCSAQEEAGNVGRTTAGLVRVSVADSDTSGHHTYAAAVRDGTDLMIGFSSGEIFSLDVVSKQKTKLAKLPGAVLAIAGDSGTGHMACVSRSADGRQIEMSVGGLDGSDLKSLHQLPMQSDTPYCSVQFSPSGKYVSFVVRQNVGRKSEITIADAQTHSVVGQFGPFDSSNIMFHSQDAAELLCWVSDQRAVALTKAGIKQSTLTSFSLVESKLKQGSTSESTFRARKLIGVPKLVVSLHRVSGKPWLAIISDMTPLVTTDRRPHTAHSLGGFLKFFIDVEGPRARIVKTSPISWQGGMIAVAESKVAGEDTVVLSSVMDAKSRTSTGFIFAERNGKTSKLQTLDDPRFSRKGRVFSNLDNSIVVYVNKETGSIWFSGQGESAKGRWVNTGLPTTRRTELFFFNDRQQHIALLECDPSWEKSIIPGTASPPTEVVIASLVDIGISDEYEYSPEYDRN